MKTYRKQKDILAFQQKSIHTSPESWAFVIQDSDSQCSFNHLGKPKFHSEMSSFIADWELPHMEMEV